MRALEELRARIDLSDDELIRAVERLAKTEAAWREAIEAGLITEEEIAQMHASMPETLRETKKLVAEVQLQDEMAAVVALSALRKHRDGNLEDALPLLRRTVATYYRGISSEPSPLQESFLERVDGLAESDPELKSLLEQP
ncbi:hypothetical protein ACFQY0_17015 [Haloferula chungangensis]|uniref:Uncharacterized protein n=2 Tax=Haloferula chungangensis TaxID=1048331 RepID=A0ABW2LBF5_9BACT